MCERACVSSYGHCEEALDVSCLWEVKGLSVGARILVISLLKRTTGFRAEFQKKLTASYEMPTTCQALC